MASLYSQVLYDPSKNTFRIQTAISGPKKVVTQDELDVTNKKIKTLIKILIKNGIINGEDEFEEIMESFDVMEKLGE